MAPLRSIVQGRLTNSELLSVLAYHLPHLSSREKTDILSLVSNFPGLFKDVPTITSVLQHDIDVGSSVPIKQSMNPAKHLILRHETDYLLSNNLEEPCSSPSLGILVGKSVGTYRFCT